MQLKRRGQRKRSAPHALSESTTEEILRFQTPDAPERITKRPAARGRKGARLSLKSEKV
jgi:hypothetical protein